MAKLIPQEVTDKVRVGPWVWLMRLVLAAVLLVFGYAVAYMMNHWQPEDFTPYVVTPKPVPLPVAEKAIPKTLYPQPVVAAAAETTVLGGLSQRGQALESLQGTVGNLSQVFLGQQLVILDSAYRQGGDVVPGIEHVKNFAATVAKNETVAKALTDLQAVTSLSGPVTVAELVLTAEALYDMEPLVPMMPSHATWWDQIVASLKRWIKVTELDNPQDPGLAWDLAVNHMRYSIAHGEAQGALKLLNQPPLMGVEAVNAFRDGLAQHLVQQQALQKVQQAFIESYKP